jgi:hypothetical protein
MPRWFLAGRFASVSSIIVTRCKLPLALQQLALDHGLCNMFLRILSSFYSTT